MTVSPESLASEKSGAGIPSSTIEPSLRRAVGVVRVSRLGDDDAVSPSGQAERIGIRSRFHRSLIVACALVLAGCGASAKPHHAAPPQPSQADRVKAVVQFHAQIPCSVEIVSLQARGRYATAVFRLGDRVTSKCASAPGPDPTGWLSAVRFTIVRGKIAGMHQLWFKPPGQPAIRWPGR